jgi:hypothetical protein
LVVVVGWKRGQKIFQFSVPKIPKIPKIPKFPKFPKFPEKKKVFLA